VHYSSAQRFESGKVWRTPRVIPLQMLLPRPRISTLAILATTAAALSLHAADAGAADTTATAAQTTTTEMATTQTATTETTTETTTSQPTTTTSQTATSQAPATQTTASSSPTTLTTSTVSGQGWGRPTPARPGGRDFVMRVRHGAHAAGDPGDTISDFMFSPASITIHVGDTITWTNNGPSPHTATANDGSFDTGTLNKGQSASHTFTQAGTFAYICKIHPFMHGTVIVLANATTNTSSSGSSNSSGSGTSTTANAAGTTTATASSGSGLPNTGLNLLGGVLAGAGLIGAGLLLRRRSQSTSG
jgi:plastocyanin